MRNWIGATAIALSLVVFAIPASAGDCNGAFQKNDCSTDNSVNNTANGGEGGEGGYAKAYGGDSNVGNGIGNLSPKASADADADARAASSSRSKSGAAAGAISGTNKSGNSNVSLEQVYEAQDRDPVASAYGHASHRYECVVGIGGGAQAANFGISVSGGYESELCNMGFVAKFLSADDPRLALLIDAMVEKVLTVDTPEGPATRGGSPDS